MRYKRSLIDLLEDVVAGISTNITIYKAVATGTSYKLNVSDVAYATIGFNITIGGAEYKITDVDNTTTPPTITVQDNNTPAVPIVVPVQYLYFSLYPVFFFHGTPMETNAEVITGMKKSEKYPMIWLWEEYKENITEDRTKSVERTVPVSIFFLQQGNALNKETDYLQTNYVEPMGRLRDLFLEQLVQTRNIFQREKFSEISTPKTRFGIYVNGKGVAKQLFADDLAGIQTDMTLKIYKDSCSMV